MGGGGEGGSGDSDHVRCVLMTLRLLLRDETYQVRHTTNVSITDFYKSTQQLLMKGAQSLATLAKVCDDAYIIICCLHLVYSCYTIVTCADPLIPCRGLSQWISAEH